MLGLCFVVATAMVNIGIIGLDEYAEVIARVIPAGVQTPQDLIKHASIRSPIPTLCLSVVTRLAKGIGFSDPANQLRFLLVTLGIFSFVAVSLSAVGLLRFYYPKESRIEKLALFLLSFYFLSPLFLTRPMFESLAVPYLTLSVYFACRYFKYPSPKWLISSLGLLTLGSLFRFQVGVCMLALFILPLLQKRPKDLITLTSAGIIFFVLTGLLDYALRGTFHGSLRAYLDFNIHNSSSFGVTPFYTYGLLWLAMSFPPLWWVSYRGFNWREKYRPLFPVLLYFLIFVAIHSAIPHKEERFMVPVLPCFLLLIVPLADWLVERRRAIPIAIFLGLNWVLLLLASFNIAQSNVVRLGRYLHYHPEITHVFAVGNTLVLVPKAYVGHKLIWGDEEKIPSTFACNEAIAVRIDYRNEVARFSQEMTELGAFPPGVLEDILIRLNFPQNYRRSEIKLFRPKGCSAVSSMPPHQEGLSIGNPIAHR